MDLMHDLKIGSKIVFFGGKGGVGKTTCSAAFAVACANKGQRTLIVSTDPAHSTSDIFERKIGDSITNIMPNLDALEISGEKESKQYMDRVRLSLGQVVSPVIIDQIKKQIDATSISPGTEEAALFDKMIEIITDKMGEYDRIVFDTAPTGHTVRLLTLPELLSAWIETLMQKRCKSIALMSMADNQGNPSKEELEQDEVIKILRKRHEKIKRAKEIMNDKGLLSFIFVINAEKLPIDETIKAISTLEKFNIRIEGIIVNKILPEGSSDAFWRQKKEQEAIYLTLIDDTFKGKSIFRLPMLQNDMKADNIGKMADVFNEFI